MNTTNESEKKPIDSEKKESSPNPNTKDSQEAFEKRMKELTERVLTTLNDPAMHDKTI